MRDSTCSRLESSRSLHGERGLKRTAPFSIVISSGRSLHGERGLKRKREAAVILVDNVAPFTGSVD